MGKDPRIVKPVYHQIAVDIAAKIVNGRYKEGERLHGRSTLASQYNVSPETIRKAVFLLQDMGIVEVAQGVGIHIESVQKAVEFIDKFRSIESLTDINQKILTLVSDVNEKNAQLAETVRTLLEYSDRYSSINPFTPFELPVGEQSPLLGKNASETNFWHNTGATIIAIRKGEEILLSPGPYTTFEPNDIVVIVGDEESYHRAQQFISPEQN